MVGLVLLIPAALGLIIFSVQSYRNKVKKAEEEQKKKSNANNPTYKKTTNPNVYNKDNGVSNSQRVSSVNYNAPKKSGASTAQAKPAQSKPKLSQEAVRTDKVMQQKVGSTMQSRLVDISNQTHKDVCAVDHKDKPFVRADRIVTNDSNVANKSSIGSNFKSGEKLMAIDIDDERRNEDTDYYALAMILGEVLGTPSYKKQYKR